MVRADDILAWVFFVGASSAATVVTDQLVPDIRWLHIAAICLALGGLGGLADYLLGIKVGARSSLPRWQCVIPLLQAVVPGAICGVVVAAGAYGVGDGVAVNPWTFFVSGLAGWRTRWAIDLVVAVVERGAKVRRNE